MQFPPMDMGEAIHLRRLTPLLPGLAGLALLVLAAVFSQSTLRQVVDSTDARKAVRENLVRAEHVLSLLKDVETGTRGYLLSDDIHYLEPYQTALRELPPPRRELRRHLASTGIPAAEVEALDKLMDQRLALAAERVALMRARQPVDARAKALGDRGRAAMDRLRAGFDSLEGSLRRRIAVLDERVRALQRRAVVAGVVLALAAGSLLILTYALLLREQTRRVRAERQQGAAALAETVAREQAEAQRHVANILESLVDGFVGLDRDWRYTYVNTQGGRMLGRAPEALIGKHIWTEFPEGERQPFAQAYRRVMETGRMEVIEDYYAPWERWFENRIYPTPEGIAIYFHEITDRKRAEAEARQARDDLRAFAARLDRDIEAERRRLAREVHDRLGQIFTALKLNLLACTPSAPLDAARVDEFGQLLDEGIRVARRISADLRPPMLDDLGLGPALAHHARRVGEQAGFAAEVDVRADARLDAEHSSQLFRIAQEALTNVARHAAARRVRIVGATEDGHYLLAIDDDGRGPPAGIAEGLGMLGMRERAELMGARLEVGPSDWGGTRLTVRLPLIAAGE